MRAASNEKKKGTVKRGKNPAETKKKSRPRHRDQAMTHCPPPAATRRVTDTRRGTDGVQPTIRFFQAEKVEAQAQVPARPPNRTQNGRQANPRRAQRLVRPK